MAAPSTAFARSTEVGGQTLQLNGAGTRYRFAFKVYDMALYTTKKVTTPAALLALPGESFTMEFEPGKGTTFTIQGKAQGAAVGNDEFFTLVLRIWFGDSPVDAALRDALLDRAHD